MPATRTPAIVQQLSPPLTALTAALFAGGVISGWLTYQSRSPVRQHHLPGTSAWWPHIILAAVACVVFGSAWWQHKHTSGRRSDRLWLLAPFGQAAGRRIARTGHAAIRGPAGAGRALAALPFAAVFGYSFYRAGEQVIGGLDPNFTVNAWGGPSYLGAMSCHYLDCFLMVAAASWLLAKILMPDLAGEEPAAAPPLVSRSAVGARCDDGGQ
jgi:hypothetical protein